MGARLLVQHAPAARGLGARAGSDRRAVPQCTGARPRADRPDLDRRTGHDPVARGDSRCRARGRPVRSFAMRYLLLLLALLAAPIPALRAEAPGPHAFPN